jgi:hypothetical protein
MNICLSNIVVSGELLEDQVIPIGPCELAGQPNAVPVVNGSDDVDEEEDVDDFDEDEDQEDGELDDDGLDYEWEEVDEEEEDEEEQDE